jgi:hypothetical protein
VKVLIQQAVPETEPLLGAAIAIQTFGDFLGFNPHCHIILTDGCFHGNKGMFRVAPPVELKKLEAIFRYKVFKMLLKKGKITAEMVRMLNTWRHSGFRVFCGKRISPKDAEATEKLARYIIRASFSQERMRYLEKEGTVVYWSKNGRDKKTFPALEWLAAMCSHIPKCGEQMVRYYGYYSNVARGKRKEAGTVDAIPCMIEPEEKSSPKKLGQSYSEDIRGGPSGMSEHHHVGPFPHALHLVPKFFLTESKSGL